MHIFVTGASGLIGRELVRRLEESGHTTTSLTRRPPVKSTQRQWNPKSDSVDAGLLEGCDLLVHLAGENIGEGRWTEEKKRRIRESRVQTTRMLSEGISQLETKPKALIVASAIGFYGNRGDEIMTEESDPGDDYLAGVCREWEQAADPAREAGIRTVHVRTGVVLSKEGGALASMITPFKLCLGGQIGNGQQHMSWISIEDIARLFQFVCEEESIAGAINGVAPNPVTNREFTKTFGRVISRPTIFPMPAFAAKLAFGEMAEALLLSSTRVLPEKASVSGFQFHHPHLEEALRSVV